MFIGFDYGTANCSVATEQAGIFRQLLLENTSPLLPSMISAPLRTVPSEWLYRCHNIDFPAAENKALLQYALRLNREEDIRVTPQNVSFGLQALENYIADPEDTWFVKSPKSFLGASGLKPQQIAFFEDLVCAMMLHIRQQAELQTETPVTHTVIGRPVNFQGIGGEDANRQAQNILLRAAQRAGFREVEFQYEPVAAGLEFEATLSRETRVLVVDIGGGTTDCSLLLMGPEWRNKADRTASLLGHSGCRVGGNDLDIMLAFKTLMPLLGQGGNSRTGTGLPTLPWWNAVAINDVNAQSQFYSTECGAQLRQMVKDAQHSELVQRLFTVWKQKQSYQLVRSAEESKIRLSESSHTAVPLSYIDAGLETSLDTRQLNEAIRQPLDKMIQQITGVMAGSDTLPDVVYLTGGSARSPLLREAIARVLPETPVTSGDDFGSVTLGLARWASTLFG
ncbi:MULTISPECIES: molecular chaperone [Tatumella]|uniref:Molecular chaperone n=1 Tax=Tatumella punctata TaxID=399969 RepID=A0ABW1VKG2_9GAMM|nr:MULTISPECIES: molecular chaperone [unclassified Tatumella]MBS0854790.1 molecular chaperone [Tatumella sp. JGM16]MBS0878432.1 molecular chaperone [Tatumella sp. JGM82]MBS0892008.1 molecular chaperone [Tatumella sp. JGM94]MBS0892945.1 molecular chaperone [Tatumella sp. JGM130]MBS0903126.1 molecular chaperone [Tatumella sp. JGM100]